MNEKIIFKWDREWDKKFIGKESVFEKMGK